ncbi:expressed unknown protein [Seminavis robusta]|uniref:Uncharacterized protein n=1 Tax=Seminavis robusta TaxID=568900 RepID=A0A9N8DNB6_9STRA|nr:expressed unknown protein [Seminavis robusta]|eukprot:Sro178_g078030.1 n/a (485) ;mRNA; f:15891-17437
MMQLKHRGVPHLLLFLVALAIFLGVFRPARLKRLDVPELTHKKPDSTMHDQLLERMRKEPESDFGSVAKSNAANWEKFRASIEAGKVPKTMKHNLSSKRKIERLIETSTSKHCLTTACIDKVATPLARSFPNRTNIDEWCFARQEGDGHPMPNLGDNKGHQGLILVKVPKAASSTTAAVVLRLGHRLGCNMNYIHWDHKPAHKGYNRRDKKKSIMILSVRDPGDLLTSHVYWSFVSLRDVPEEDVSPEFLVEKVKDFGIDYGSMRDRQGGFTLQFSSLERIPVGAGWDKEEQDLVHPQDAVKRVKGILNAYDFALVVERMDESLVALALLLGVPVGDVLVSSSKVSAPTGANGSEAGKTYVYSKRLKRCLPLVKSHHPPLLQRYLDSDHFRSQSYGDLILHAAANRSLDLTIERLGKEQFEKAMKEYLYWKKRMEQECSSMIHSPCSSDGKLQLSKSKSYCYGHDMGCGHKCIDRMLANGRDQT